MPNIKAIADKADVIINGYAFSRDIIYRGHADM